MIDADTIKQLTVAARGFFRSDSYDNIQNDPLFHLLRAVANDLPLCCGGYPKGGQSCACATSGTRYCDACESARCRYPSDTPSTPTPSL